MLDFFKSIFNKLFMVIVILAIVTLCVLAVAFVAHLYSCSVWAVAACVAAIAVLWEAGERLILHLRLVWMRKKRKTEGRYGRKEK